MGLLVIMAVASCASHVAADTQSVQSGPWNDPDIELLETRDPEEIAGTPDSDDDGS
jgi:hypothetical protein